MLFTSLAIVAVSTVIAAELLLRLPFWPCAQLMLRTSRKATAIVSSKKISDHWKEKVLLRYSCVLAGQSLKLAALFLAVIVSVVAFASGSDFLFQPAESTLQVLTQWRGLITASMMAVVYLGLRKHFVP